MPDGQLVLGADAPREQWLAERRKGIGGSDIATLLGINPYQSEYELW
ncbi:MAG: YqaJ viral recombinase family protein, partial [Sciscionella sp.]